MEASKAPGGAAQGGEWVVLYERPDGWVIAGEGFDSEENAKQAARVQLPSHVRWLAEPSSSELVTKARALIREYSGPDTE